MNVSDVFDWTFMWQMMRNFTGTFAPFVMVAVAVGVAGWLISFVVNLFLKRKSS